VIQKRRYPLTLNNRSCSETSYHEVTENPQTETKIVMNSYRVIPRPSTLVSREKKPATAQQAHSYIHSYIQILVMSATQSTTVHDGLLHPNLRHCSSAASAVRRLPSAVRTATPAFDVRSSGLFCSRPGGLELVTRLRDPSRFFGSFRRDLKTFLFSFY